MTEKTTDEKYAEALLKMDELELLEQVMQWYTGPFAATIYARYKKLKDLRSR